ncbi:MAG: DUF5787 family protein [Halobaculum sp.]
MYAGAGETEFTFELLVSRWAELAWHPTRGDRPALVARQLGTQQRRWDTVVVEVDPAAFERRRALGDRGLDRDLLRVVERAPAEWEWYRDALPDPGFSWEYVRAAIHRAAGRELVETRHGTGGRVEFRRVQPYPDWVRRLIAVENKPSLDAAAADALVDQIEHDVSAGLLDEVWVATDADDADRALLETFPVEAGVLACDFGDGVTADAAAVHWHAGRLEPDETITSADREESPEAHPSYRAELAERAYDAGWRSYHETMRPDCRAFELRRAGRGLVPYCTAKACHQTASECAGSCVEFTPEPPQWRTGGWPVAGGPGKGFTRLLDRRRRRHRERLEDAN